MPPKVPPKLHANTKHVYVWTDRDIAEAAGVSMSTFNKHKAAGHIDESSPLSIAFYLARYSPQKTRHEVVDWALGLVTRKWKKSGQKKRVERKLEGGKTYLLTMPEFAAQTGLTLMTAHQHRKRGNINPDYLISFAFFFAKYGSREVRHNILDCAFGATPTKKMWKVEVSV